MTINFGPEGNPHGTFDSFFDVFFDIRFGDLSGPIVDSQSLRLTSTDTPWSHIVPPGALSIDGVNHNLNNSDNGEDFWPVGSITEQHAAGLHVVAAASVPEAGTTLGLLLIALGFCGLGQCIQKARLNPKSR